MKLSILSTLSALISLTYLLKTEGAGLRASPNKKIESDTTRALETENSKFIECVVFENDGVSLPEQDELPQSLLCEEDYEEDTFGGTMYSLVGETASFFQEVNLDNGDVQIRFPEELVNLHDEVHFNEGTVSQITITFTGNDRRRKLVSLPSKGTMRLLIIAVGVPQSAYQIAVDTFGKNNRNLRNIYKNCSGNQLKINPSQVKGAVHGVLTIPPPANVCSYNYVKLSNYAKYHSKAMAAYGTATIDHYMFVLPNDNCVNFRGGQAWGEIGGRTTWVQANSQAFPIVQVHEVGHNMGFQHSATLTNSYGDGTDYMSNKAVWDKEGNKMCFNGAKLWYFNWYPNDNQLVRATTSTQTFKVVPLADVRKNRRISGGKLVLSVRSTSAHLFIWFNRAKQVNSGVTHDRNKVVVNMQSGKSMSSHKLSALSGGQTYTYHNFENGKTLYIKVNSINYSSNPYVAGDQASVSIWLG
ncbi:hypothetical protein CTEN210_17905 [Chaetoceros tenuissimus]|uniref:Peptidase M11 gametolysin domain-containing protein n=1 Tax=Chaetoceros tenuissimus TaxID=426638 RepID=A0AAD3HFN8_9STRA|nr:hypothetical protein CTEN210_17905 [Chaetoceros tenuissimus]